jgi:hypothetical protein
MIPSTANRETPHLSHSALPTADGDAKLTACSTAVCRTPWQFRTSSLLWLTFTAAMTLAYARLFGPRAMGLVIATPLAASLLGATIGWRAGRVADAIYWAVIGATLGAVSTAGAPISPATSLFWPFLGAVVGGATGAYRPSVSSREWIISIALGLAAWAIFGPKPMGFWSENEFSVDLSIAPVIAVGLAYLIRMIDGLQARYGTSRDAWAAGLVFAVIAGNLWAARIAGRIG